jgi:hypothetical protein
VCSVDLTELDIHPSVRLRIDDAARRPDVVHLI